MPDPMKTTAEEEAFGQFTWAAIQALQAGADPAHLLARLHELISLGWPIPEYDERFKPQPELSSNA